ncbi:MAG: Spy/CpxP family protein refolding chaperone [Xanthobacteraceae bacterium]|nr:Spy/CpxP family protein refolding chaperone [Xanthobacteraceae bacterium]
MLKLAAAGATALFMTASPLAYAQSTSTAPSERLSAADWNTVTDLRIELIKSALQLTPDQAKLWPAVEEAIRARAKNRQARIARVVETTGARADEGRMEILRNRDPIRFMERHADALAQRSADLKKLASAWQPLYATLSQDQKRRMAALAIFAVRDMTDAVERHRLQAEDDDD